MSILFILSKIAELLQNELVYKWISIYHVDLCCPQSPLPPGRPRGLRRGTGTEGVK